jgi:methylphosphotriester-DNA--protein-cysteine methyltransferase
MGLIRLFDRVAAAPNRVAAAVRLIDRTGGTISMDRLVHHTGATSRWLERQFQAFVGMPPKRYARVVRFHRARQRADHAFRVGFFQDAGASAARYCAGGRMT